MHSLAYLSRQLASPSNQTPRTPPSTPTADGPQGFISSSSFREGESSHSGLRRIQTWSTRSFLIPSAKQTNTRSRERSRSFSNLASAGESSRLRRKPSLSVPPSRSSQPRILPRSFVRHLAIFRVFALFYGWMHAIWEFVTRRDLTQIRHTETETSGDEKESEDEGKRAVVSVLMTPPTPPDSSNQHTYSNPPPLSPESSPPTTPIRLSLNIAPPETPESESPRSLSQSLLPNPFCSSIFASSRPRPSQITVHSTASPGTPTLKRILPEQKTLVLDLDETLIHSTTRPLYSPRTGWLSFSGFGFSSKTKGGGHMVEVVLGGRSTSYHVYKRPFVDYFLRKVSTWYTLVIFTASMPEYADPVIDWLDAGRGIIARRFFRESCTQLANGSYSKDLSIIEPDLARVCLVDNSPISYSINQANGIPIEGWTHDPSDEALLDLLPVLDSLRFTKDVRRVLGIRGFS